MNAWETLSKDIKTVANRSNIQSMVGEVILTNQEIIVKQVKERWEKGESSVGGIIGRYRWEEYRMFKEAMNPLAGGNVDLIFTGKLSNGLAVRKYGSIYQVYSEDEKYHDIGEKYGYEEYGLTKEQMDEFYEFIYSKVMIEMLNQIYD